MSRITTLDAFEKEYREGLGRPMPPRPWREVTPEWLRRHGDGSGDFNPLFRDPAYARAGRFHQLVASPSFVFSMNFGANASIWGHIPAADVAMKDLSILYLGADIDWYRPVWVGDRVRSIETPVDVRPTTTRQLGEALICSGRTQYFNHRAELVAQVTNRMLRFANPGRGVRAGEPGDRPRVAPDPLVWERTRRGAQPRYWDDVRAGEELPELPKGTFTTTELYLFAHGSLSTNRSRYVDDGTIDMGAGGRADPEYARASRSQATSFDYGPQRIAWLTQVVSDWTGDHGDLVRLSSRLHRPNLVGDTNTVTARVSRVLDADDTGGEVEIEAAVLNQDRIRTATATAVVRLPRPGALPDHSVLFAPETDAEPGIYG
jgi:acyl dehydratase